MSRLKRGMCHEEDIQNILTKLEELETDMWDCCIGKNREFHAGGDPDKYKKLQVWDNQP